MDGKSDFFSKKKLTDVTIDHDRAYPGGKETTTVVNKDTGSNDGLGKPGTARANRLTVGVGSLGRRNGRAVLVKEKRQVGLPARTHLWIF